MDSRSKCSHSPSLADRTFTCPSCAWRAVVTTDGRIVQTQPGEGGYDHIGQAMRQVLAIKDEAERVMTRLRQHYADRALLPSGEQMSLNVLQRLYRHVIAEYAP